MTSAQQYYDGLVQQGHDAAMALSYTQQHYPDFSAEIPAPEPTPQPMTVAPAAPVVANVTAVGKFCETSFEKDGPDNILNVLYGRTSLITSVKNLEDEISIPFEQIITL